MANFSPEAIQRLRERTILMNKSRAEDITGQIFNGIEILREVEHSKDGARRWECKCHCGKIFITTTTWRAKRNHSCGCKNKEIISQKNSTHGLSKTNLYNRYRKIKERCYKPCHKSYKDYGGRGIKMCNEWLGENGFVRFYDWAINNGYDKNLSLDRIDNNKGYSPDNCRWVDSKTQARNRRNNRFIEFNGSKKTIAEWSEIIGVHPDTIRNRLERGLPIEKVLYSGSLRSVKVRLNNG